MPDFVSDVKVRSLQMKLSVAEDTFVCRVYGLIVIATCWKIYCVRLK